MPTSISGTSGVTFPDNSTQSTAALGVGQTWQNLTASRAAGTTYTNNTGRPIMMSATCPASGTAGTFWIYVDGVEVGYFNNANTSAQGTLTAVIPNGSTYYVTITAGSLARWTELR